MMTDDLNDLVRRLRAELMENPRFDGATAESLERLAAEIHGAIGGRAGDGASVQDEINDAGSLSGRVRGYIEQFEADHPQLTQTLSVLAERLADMGI
ncbi:MAG: DUF4404 family protein [Planctomycetota bacterium]|jgi:hypothetical protein